jgi:hypothetical protein
MPKSTSKDEHHQQTRFWLVNLAIVAGAVALSVLAGVYTRPSGLRFDEKYYFALAKSIAGGVYDDGYLIRPPLYPLFLGAMVRVFGTGFTATMLVQSLIGVQS